MDRALGVCGGLVGKTTPYCVILYAVWTVYVQILSLTHGTFTTLLWFLPLVLLVSALAALAWVRRWPLSLTTSSASDDTWTAGAGARWWFVAAAGVWVVVYAFTRNFTLFWWGGTLGMAGAWFALSRRVPVDRILPTMPHRAGWWLVGLCLAAALVALVANRPDIDDSFYLSIPATLLRDPLQPILLHDTLYRLPALPIEFVGYREHTYEVLIGVVSWVTGLAPIVVGHLVLPPIFAVLSVLAWAWLLRMLAPDSWLTSLALLVLCMLLLGETHHAYGNFGFVRIFQGKAIELCWSVPAIIGSALVWMRNGTLASWLLLMASQIAAIGITSTGLFVAPVAAGLALAGGWLPNAKYSLRFLLGCCASWYVVVVGVLLAVAQVGGHEWSPGYATSVTPLAQIVVDTWGRWSILPLLLALLAAWATCGSQDAARVFAAASLLFLLVCFDPYTYAFMANHVMGESALWRLSWAIPLPLMLAVMFRGTLARSIALPVRWQGWKWAVWVMAGALVVWAALGVGTLRAANKVTLGVPRVKAPAADYALASRLVRDMPEFSTLLAPVAIASWCSTFVRHPQLLAVRPMYLQAVAKELGQANAQERYALQLYVSGWKRDPGAVALLKDGVSRYHLQTVVMARAAPWANEAGDTLSALGFRAVDDGAYTVWSRSR